MSNYYGKVDEENMERRNERLGIYRCPADRIIYQKFFNIAL